MDCEFWLPAHGGFGKAIEIDNEHLSFRFLAIYVKDLVLRDNKRTALRPVILINLRKLVASYQWPSSK